MLLVSDRFRSERLGRSPAARIAGWAHGTAGLPLQPKLDRSQGQPYVFQHVRGLGEEVIVVGFQGCPEPAAAGLGGQERRMWRFLAADAMQTRWHRCG